MRLISAKVGKKVKHNHNPLLSCNTRCRLWGTDGTKADISRRTDYADKMAHMWEMYACWKFSWFGDGTLTMDDFADFMRRSHYYDIKA